MLRADHTSRHSWSAPILIATMGIGALLWSARLDRPGRDHAARGAAPALRVVGGPARSAPRTPAAMGPTLTDVASPALARRMAHVARKPRLTKQRVADLVAMLQELERRGTAAVPVIGELLRSGINLDLGTLESRGPRGERTLREALIDALLQIGGAPATAVALEQLRATRDPLETTLLARGLEALEPGAHSGVVLDAIDDTLEWAGEARESADLGPLFELLRGYGGERALALLERSVPQWGEYASIALAGLPNGEGVPTLTALAAAGDAPIENRVLPFQALGQATTGSPEAAEALLDLARSDRIPDQAWRALGDVLAGKHLRFARTMLDGTPAPGSSGERPSAWKSYYIEWMNVRYEQDTVTADWTPDQVQRQVALIDDLLAAAPSAVATDALQRARTCLQP